MIWQRYEGLTFMNGGIPNRIPLTGGDFFTLVMERGVLVSKPPANLCRLRLRLDGKLDKRELEDEINTSGLGDWMSSVRWSRAFPFLKPKWKAGGGNFAVDEHDLDGELSEPLPPSLLNKVLSPFRPPAFSVDLLHGKDGNTSVLLSWHHALMDARGAEMLLSYMGRTTRGETAKGFFTPKRRTLKDNIDTWLNLFGRSFLARKSIHTVARYCRPPIASLLRDRVKIGGKLFYYVKNFDAEVTRSIDEACQNSGAGFRVSIFYLASSIMAFHKLMVMRGTVSASYVVPVPQDTRRRGATGPIFGNQFTFLFFRAEVDDLTSIENLIKVLTAQMLDQMRKSVPESFVITMELFRNLPVGIFAIQALTVTNGQIASFFFSCPGEVLGGMESFQDKKVEEVLHLPPANVSPGISIIFSRYNARLSSVISYAEGCIDKEEVEMLAREISLELTRVRKEL